MAPHRHSVNESKPKSKTPHFRAKVSRSAPSHRVSDFWLKAIICLLLIVVTAGAYWHVIGCQFIESYDDQEYVTNNTAIASGLNAASLKWALTTFYASNWHPLTWISHIVDVQLFGLNPVGHHLVNLLLHILNALLLFTILSRLTQSIWKSAFVAALFAVHPLHVESVAWIAERKDVLSTMFWFIALWAYAAYVARPGVWRYMLIMAAFGAGLMSKPMLVSLPLTLLLLDYWPLGRLSVGWKKLIAEKIPLALMSAASCIVTMFAQQAGQAVATAGEIGLAHRLANAVVAYAAYIIKTVWPSRLAVLYPVFETHLLVWQIIGAAVLLAAISIGAVLSSRRRPYLLMGWLWYVITLIPVIGLVQVGSQSMADRYTYVTIIGLFIMAIWLIADIAADRIAWSRAIAATSVAIVCVLAVCTWRQVCVWQNSVTLFDHAIKVTPRNSIAHNNKGTGLVREGRMDEAIDELREAIKIQPEYGAAHNNLGVALVQTDHLDEGTRHLRIAAKLGMKTARVHQHIAEELVQKGEMDEAAEQCRLALKQDPDFGQAHFTLGMILGMKNKHKESLSHFKTAAKLAPNDALGRAMLAVAYFQTKDYESAWREAHRCRELGGDLSEGFVKDLTSAMPEPLLAGRK